MRQLHQQRRICFNLKQSRSRAWFISMMASSRSRKIAAGAARYIGVSMAAPIDLRNNSDRFCRLAKRTRDATQSRRLLALAEVADRRRRSAAIGAASNEPTKSPWFEAQRRPGIRRRSSARTWRGGSWRRSSSSLPRPVEPFADQIAAGAARSGRFHRRTTRFRGQRHQFPAFSHIHSARESFQFYILYLLSGRTNSGIGCQCLRDVPVGISGGEFGSWLFRQHRR